MELLSTAVAIMVFKALMIGALGGWLLIGLLLFVHLVEPMLMNFRKPRSTTSSRVPLPQ
ncbi:hypothetical protein HC891_19790 [Candidatus Gracilibacteria bacterium]|nr:hypothetical protein [Candidatus Gracilibacteria bacterium]